MSMLTLGRRRTGPDAAALARPRLADDVAVHAPTEPDVPWVAQRGTREYLRIGKDLGRLMQEMDGERDAAALAGALGAPWTPETVERVVHDLADKQLLADGRRRRRSQAQWVKFVPPLTLQLTLLRPAQVAKLLAPVAAAFASRTGMISSGLFVAAGALAVLVQAPVLTEALSSSLPFGTYLWLALAFLLGMTLHEFSHGVALVHYGGRPSRMGFMLFYLTPAFFCDVSDAWRLPHRRQRVRVALAGVGMQALIGAAAGLLALLLPLWTEGTATRYALLVIAVANLLASLLNLIPLVKLDGYIALMSHVDEPHLRRRSLVDARRLIARVLFGGTYEREVPALRWAPYFGLGCMAFPIVLVMMALSLWMDLLVRAGVVGVLALAAGVAYFVYYLGRGLARTVREAHRAGARPVRTGAGVVALLAAVTVALLTVPVPYQVAGGYHEVDGQTYLVLPTSVAHVDVPAGADVTLARGGMVLQHTTGAAVTVTGEAEQATAPQEVFLPVALPDFIDMQVYRYPVEVHQQPDEARGVATVHLAELPLGEWMYEMYAAPVLAW